MILNDNDALKRLNSSDNLMNKIKALPDKPSSRSAVMGLFGLGRNGSNKPSSITAELVEPDKTKPEDIPEFPKATFNDGKTFNNPFSKPVSVNGNTVAKPEIKTGEILPAKEPKIDDLIGNVNAQVKLAQAHDLALLTLNDSLTTLRAKLDDLKPDKLASVVSATAKVVEGIRRERSEATKNSKGQDVHYHFYTPVQKNVDDYKLTEVGS